MLPGVLFARLWQQVVPHQHDVRVLPWHGRQASEFPLLHDLMVDCDEADVPVIVTIYLDGGDIGHPCDVADQAQRAFVVMCALDDAAIFIHPAMKSRLPSRSKAPGGLLQAMKQERTIEGFYGRSEHGFVLPKGHLDPKKPRTNFDEASGVDLAHQFSYLSFVPVLSNGQVLTPLVIPPSQLMVPQSRARFVGLAPVAEDHDDFDFSVSTRLAHPFLDAIPRENPLSERIGTTVEAMLDKGAGLVVLPELVTSPASLIALSDRLRASARRDGALIVAGSGPSAVLGQGNNRPFNEAAVLTASGEVLYRQRKINPFNMSAERMADCHIDPAAGYADRNHLEDCAMGNELVVCDVIGLGRIVILICEDVEQEAPGGTICLRTFPDWIVTPILDVKLEFGRWTHRRAIEIARKTLSRVVVSSSATLTLRWQNLATLSVAPAASIATGLLFDGMESLRGTFVKVGGTASGRFDVVEWKTDTWVSPWITPAV
jgi:hypothetical protein